MHLTLTGTDDSEELFIYKGLNIANRLPKVLSVDHDVWMYMWGFACLFLCVRVLVCIGTYDGHRIVSGVISQELFNLVFETESLTSLELTK